MSWLEQAVKPLDRTAERAAQERQQQLTKPAGALGVLEQLAIRLAGMQGRVCPRLESVSIAVFAADHGVAAEGVSAYPQAVTAEMIRNFARGGAAISVAARALGAELSVWNLGTVVALETLPGVESRIIAPQSSNLLHEPAMTGAQLQQALDTGREAVLRSPTDLFIGGEMGIGNTTAATALAAMLLEQPVKELVGPGTGLDSTGMALKCQVIEQALERHGNSRAPLMLLASLGGFEVAALTGAYLACAQAGIPALVDGFICTVAALLSCRLNPAVADWLLFSHHSAEPGYRLLSQALPSAPLLDMGLRLGEGSGAALAVPLLRMACQLHAEMATFAEAAVSEKGS
ncbi:nicotinate-nucleotide--dimethylbenzimidazole phosphoribosyltransferase [Marinobacterium sediminicola]|uniref:Nicotinate-nucleotide--dimethylbenzimidazole phosphoribosyltransferase n=1 Tax=Marinobacterium sediminicola TaxID=518898 RepID=A0ABY1S1X1_9GAMM|nr:nicotinate-nucleotide--dimethylbenzimidazole phosphoribosyltransferase [Marinobacterium sediminicola]ULG69431.1 nicotinate-nucleotide--dimethylbenzimidazole phosphoribosyltransferase [Marinobacterium sediminicola]SMR75581.1 nicotinate-nucleotide-dimethylbenzimidazole phosphoribosyltransferase [Marinobacterium sediminicola]